LDVLHVEFPQLDGLGVHFDVRHRVVFDLIGFIFSFMG
jgi:hypothetical protein